jgi:hypothetical protein
VRSADVADFGLGRQVARTLLDLAEGSRGRRRNSGGSSPNRPRYHRDPLRSDLPGHHDLLFTAAALVFFAFTGFDIVATIRLRSIPPRVYWRTGERMTDDPNPHDQLTDARSEK